MKMAVDQLAQFFQEVVRLAQRVAPPLPDQVTPFGVLLDDIAKIGAWNVARRIDEHLIVQQDLNGESFVLIIHHADAVDGHATRFTLKVHNGHGDVYNNYYQKLVDLIHKLGMGDKATVVVEGDPDGAN